MSQFVLAEYFRRTKSNEVDPQSLHCMDGVVCVLLEGIIALREDQFQCIFPALFSSINELVEVGSPAIRTVVRKLFDYRLKLFLGLSRPS
jgi:hypothetical protein